MFCPKTDLLPLRESQNSAFCQVTSAAKVAHAAISTLPLARHLSAPPSQVSACAPTGSCLPPPKRCHSRVRFTKGNRDLIIISANDRLNLKFLDHLAFC